MPLTEQDVIRLARGAGFSESDIPTAVTIAHYESGFDPNATHRNTDGSIDTGIWQINDKANGDLIAKYGGNAKDPASNALMAKAVFDRQGWQAWSTYNAKAPDWGIIYDRAHYDTDHTPGTTTKTGGTQLAPGIQNPLNSIGNAITSPFAAFGKIASTISDSEFWKRVGLGVLAAIVIIVGIALMIDQSKTVQAAVNVAGKI